jgi:polysaccharide biosynthesis/export protein
MLVALLSCPLIAQNSGSTERTDLTAEEILLKQVQTKSEQSSLPQMLNEQMQALAGMPRTAMDYHLGAGDVIELTVAGIPGLDRKVFSLDGQGRISVPYLGEVDLLGLTTRDSETRLIKLFSVSLLEDPQVSITIKEHKSQNYYVWGAVKKPGKYSISESTDILDALSNAGGLTEKADSKIRLYRYPQRQASESIAPDMATNTEASDSSIPSNSMDINLSELLDKARSNNRMAILSGDVIEVQERKERNYYVLGDVLKPGPFSMHPNESMVLSQALGSAGGMLKTASGSKVVILRHNEGGALPNQIKVDAYKVLKGTSQDIELLHNDIVLVPGSASKTLGKAFLSGVGGLLGTLLIIGAN